MFSCGNFQLYILAYHKGGDYCWLLSLLFALQWQCFAPVAVPGVDFLACWNLHVRVASSSWFTTQCEAFQSHSALFIVSLLLQTKAMSAWEKCLEAAKIPEPARAKLLELGFDTQEAFSFKDEKVFEVFAKDFLLVDLKLDGATETNWACKPLVQKLRALWMKGCGGGAAPQALALPYTPVVVGACPGSGLLLGSNKGLTVADRDQLRRALEAKYTGCVVDLESLPSMPFLNIVKTQHDNKAWDWLP